MAVVRMQAFLPSVPFVSGVQCARCRSGIAQAGGSAWHYVSGQLNRGGSGDSADYYVSDVWAWHVIGARENWQPDPQPPERAWGHAQPPGPVRTADEPLSASEVERLRRLLSEPPSDP